MIEGLSTARPSGQPPLSDPELSDCLALAEGGWIDATALAAVLETAPFLKGLILRDTERFRVIATVDPALTLADNLARLDTGMAGAADEAAAMAVLRRFRQVLALVTALSDLSGHFDLVGVTQALSDGADAALDAAAGFALRQAGGASLEGYAIIAMGKHGARELNYSSDIDIIAVFDPERVSVPEGKEITPFFVRLTQMIAKLLQTRTEDGYVFRVDLRLRPDPGATPVAITFAGAMNYYEALGQNWERAALIKARPAAGDTVFGATYLKALAPFIWRRHLDFAAIADVHAMKRQIHAAKGHGAIAVEGHNIKLGRGGIREIEFFVQTQQLIAGGRAPELRARETCAALDRLVDAGWIEAAARDDLQDAYVFLRTVENRLQMVADEQTHTLPTETEAVTAFARFCGFEDRDAFAAALTARLACVQTHYEALFAGERPLAGDGGSLVFTGVEPDDETLESLGAMGFGQPSRVWETIVGWHQGRIPAMRSAKSRELLTELMPALFQTVSETGSADAAFVAFDRFVSQLPAGVQLFSVLNANPRLLSLLIAILGTAPRLATALVRRPTLLEAVLDPRFFGELPKRATIARTLDQSLDATASYEERLDAARLVGQDQAFLIGVRQLTGNLPHGAAGAAYTALAELLIDRLLAAAWDQVRSAHGDIEGGRVVIVGMGKLGGREMNAASDLDLILIYDHSPTATGSNGNRPLAPSQYFSRLTQRLIAALSAQTATGNLYDVDMRLRPSGRSGPVATHVDSFAAYQQERAWLWEHMALTRARCVCGDTGLAGAVDTIIADVLGRARDAGEVRQKAVEMRRRIEVEKGAATPWNLKVAQGGLVDIEFIAQALQLAYAPEEAGSRLRSTSDALQALGARGVLSDADRDALVAALALYDALSHRLAVCISEAFDPGSAPAGLLQRLTEAAALPDFVTLAAYLKESQQQVRAIFERLMGVVSSTEPTRPGAGNP